MSAYSVGVTANFDNSDAGFTSFGHTYTNFTYYAQQAVNGGYAIINSSGTQSTDDSYFMYEISGLPATTALYDLRMYTNVRTSHCDALSYKVLNASQEEVAAFLVSHAAGNDADMFGHT